MGINGAGRKPALQIPCLFQIQREQRFIAVNDLSVFYGGDHLVLRHQLSRKVDHIFRRLPFEIGFPNAVRCFFQCFEFSLQPLSCFHLRAYHVEIGSFDIFAFQLAVFHPLQIKAFFSAYHLFGNISCGQSCNLVLDLPDAVGCIGHLCTSFPQLSYYLDYNLYLCNSQ
nr:hypothetical protein [uncultured Ruminococcus sp.]